MPGRISQPSDRFRHFALVLAALCAAGFETAPVRGADSNLTQAATFHIAQQPLETALIEFSKQAGVPVSIAATAVKQIQAPALSGTMPVGVALGRLLDESGLRYVELGDTVAVMRGDRTAQQFESGRGDAEEAGRQKPAALRSSSLTSTEGNDAGGGAPAATGGQRKELEEVVVTAQKREERLLDTPQSVSVLSGDAIQRLAATQFRDFANTVPGLDFVTAGAGQSQISLRGLNTGFDIGSTIGVYVDDIPFGTSGAFAQGAQNTIDVGLFDLDRIEVLRGPQGTLYGASTMGGLIKYVTTPPNTTDFSGDAQAGVSNTKDGGTSYNVAAGVNLPLSPGLAGVRAVGYQTHDGGYIDNVALGQNNVNRSNIYGGRLDFLLTPTDALTIRLDGFLQNITRDGQSTVDYTLAGSPVYGALDQFRKVEEPWDQRFRLVSGTISYDFGPATLTSISSYQTVRSHYVFDVSPLYVPLFAGAYSAIGYPVDTGTNKVTEELRLASKQGTLFDWLAGGFYTHESTTNVEKLQPYTPGGVLSSDNLFSFSNPSTYTEYSAFGDLTWHVLTQLDITGGLRYSHDNQSKTQIGGGLFGSSQPETSSDENVVTYLGNARYHFTQHEVGYVRFATGYRPGGPNFVSFNPITHVPNGPPTFGSDHLHSYEAGFKAETEDRRFGVDVAAYYIDWSNIQVSVSTGNGFSGIGNAAGGATVDGAELTLSARPIQDLAFTGAFAYQHAYLKEAEPNLGAREGEDLPNVPRYSGNINADYTLTENRLLPTVGATVRYVDDRTTSFDASKSYPQYRLPNYTTADLRAGLTVGPVITQLYVHNLFDKRGQLGVLFPQFGNYVAIMQPRTVGITVSTHF